MGESPRTLDGLGLEELKSLLVQALEDVARLKAENEALREEMARLKGLNGRPKLKPSGMEKATETSAKGARKIGRRGAKRSKLTIHETRTIKAENVPAGARFKGYEEFVVQDLMVRPLTVLYRRERWLIPSGETVVAPLPAGIASHFGPELKRFVLAQYHQGQTTIARLLALLQDLGVGLSKRQLMRLLIEGHDAFLDEARDVLRTGLEAASWITVDDTGARHKAQNGVCTHIGNDQFAAFATTSSKSRLNFLELLNAGDTTHLVNEAALAYMRERNLSGKVIALLSVHADKRFADRAHAKAELATRFDAIFTTTTGFVTLDRLLGRLNAHKADLLMVLERPDVPLHTNRSENDIRTHVTRRKVSGGTRSDTGRDCRDAFLGLMKTCAKQTIRFWDYLGARLGVPGAPHVPRLPDLIRLAEA
jgi:hypothetical protein